LIDMLAGGTAALSLMIMLLIGKFIFSMISFCSGAPGGIFFPLLVLGALAGSIVGRVSVMALGIPESYVVNLIASNLAIGGEIYVNTYDVTYATERENGYLVCDILVLDAVSGRYFRFLYDGELLRVTQEVTKSGGYYRVNVRNNVSGIKTVNVYAEYDAFGRLLSVTAKNTAIISSSFIYKDNGHRVKIFTLLQKDMITPCTQVYVGE